MFFINSFPLIGLRERKRKQGFKALKIKSYIKSRKQGNHFWLKNMSSSSMCPASPFYPGDPAEPGNIGSPTHS